METKCAYCGNPKELGQRCPDCGSFEIAVEHDDLPCGILCLSNITMRQWEDVMKAYREAAKTQGDGWRGVVVVAGLDPANETKVTYTEIP